VLAARDGGPHPVVEDGGSHPTTGDGGPRLVAGDGGARRATLGGEARARRNRTTQAGRSVQQRTVVELEQGMDFALDVE
jgi:hypothetical protein